MQEGNKKIEQTSNKVIVVFWASLEMHHSTCECFMANVKLCKKINHAACVSGAWQLEMTTTSQIKTKLKYHNGLDVTHWVMPGNAGCQDVIMHITKLPRVWTINLNVLAWRHRLCLNNGSGQGEFEGAFANSRGKFILVYSKLEFRIVWRCTSFIQIFWLKLVAGAVMTSLSCCTSKRLKSKPKIIVLDGIAIVKIEPSLRNQRINKQLLW
jgi:hypothetical protein